MRQQFAEAVRLKTSVLPQGARFAQGLSRESKYLHGGLRTVAPEKFGAPGDKI